MNKVVGYVLTLAGIAVLALGFKPVQTALSVTLPFSNMITMILGLVLALIGIFLVKKSSSSAQSPEVPIYEGKNIVGYRKVN